MKNDGKRISQASNIKLQNLNWADYRLYDYFKRKLDNESYSNTLFLTTYLYDF